MMAAFYIGCGLSLAGCRAVRRILTTLAVAMFALGMFAAIYHPVGMAMLIEAIERTRPHARVQRRVRQSRRLACCRHQRGACHLVRAGARHSLCRPCVLVLTGIVYLWVTPDDRHQAKSRVSAPAVPLTPRLAVMLFGLFIVIALSAGLTFNVLTIALPKIVDERLVEGPSARCSSAALQRPFWFAGRWRN